MQWLQEYYFLDVGTFCDDSKHILLWSDECSNITRLLFSTWWNILWCIETNFLLKYCMQWLHARILFSTCWDLLWWIKTNFRLKYCMQYCMQWLKEYCFLHVGTFCDASKWIFFWSLVCNDCKNTVFHMLEHCVMHQNKLIFVWSIVCNDRWLQEYCFPHVLTLSDESKRI